MSINPKEAPEGFYAAPTTGGLIPICTGCWFYGDKEQCPSIVSCVKYYRIDNTHVIYLKLDCD